MNSVHCILVLLFEGMKDSGFEFNAQNEKIGQLYLTFPESNLPECCYGGGEKVRFCFGRQTNHHSFLPKKATHPSPFYNKAKSQNDHMNTSK